MTTALESMVISTPEAEGEIYLQGAHVARWQPRGERQVLFLSSKSAFEPGKAIRGGVPVIFPWFGPRSDGQAGPAHGLARTALWEWDGETFRLKVEQFQLRFVVKMGAMLEMSLEVTNEGAGEVRFEEALVWNPWTGMADLGPEEWQGMICVETANVGENAVLLAPGATHRMTAAIRLQS